MADQEFTQTNHVDQYPKQENYHEKITELLSDNLPENGGGDASNVTPGTQINASKNDDDERKIFVGGLSWETAVSDMREYFSKFGEVVDCTLKSDPSTGRSRGFGFVLFADASAVNKVIAAEAHNLHGRTIDPKRAKARGGREPIKKVFVGGLDPELPEADIREFFGKFGKIEDIDLPFDKVKNQRRAFCFITFESEEIVNDACQMAKQTIHGKEVDVKKATPKSEQSGYNSFGGRGNFPVRGRAGGYPQYGANPYYDHYSTFGYEYNQGYGQGYGAYDYYGNGGNAGWGYPQGGNGYQYGSSADYGPPDRYTGYRAREGM